MIMPCQRNSTYVEEVDARHHEGVDDSEDNVGLKQQLLATANRLRRSNCYLVANTVKCNGPTVIMSALCSYQIEVLIYIRYHHDHEIPDPRVSSAWAI